ncbi:hypothetical protein J6590_020550 [Homalodisca vitripennis]|nr:hypothetical protein J6590_020550 [Homalodisca vitripennis]
MSNKMMFSVAVPWDIASTFPPQTFYGLGVRTGIGIDEIVTVVNIDWATLAQQWIKMKETFPVDQIPPAPPPPSIKADIEAGEAPMDMSKDEVTPTPPVTAPQDGSSWGSWNNWQQWGWGWGGGAPSGAVGSAVPPDKAVPYTFAPPTTAPSYSTDTSTTTTFDYNHGAPVTSENFEQVCQKVSDLDVWHELTLLNCNGNLVPFKVLPSTCHYLIPTLFPFPETLLKLILRNG